MTKTVAVPIEKIVIVTENHGGYLGGKCILCGACGWLDEERKGYNGKLGFPLYAIESKANPTGIMGNRLFHKENCPMTHALDDKGNPT